MYIKEFSSFPKNNFKLTTFRLAIFLPYGVDAWVENLTRTPYLVLFIILISIGVGTASALITITLAGNVIVTDNLDVQGNITGPTITNLQSQINQGIAEQGCPEGEVITGFGSNGTGICNSILWDDLINVPSGLDNGDQDGLRTFNKNPVYGKPCDKLNSDTSTIDHLFREKASIEQLGFDSFFGNLPIFAEAQEQFIAEIRMFAGTFAPQGWAFAQGQLLQISQNPALFALLGTQYGGDGEVTFALPDLRCLEPEGNTGPHYIIALIGTFPSES